MDVLEALAHEFRTELKHKLGFGWSTTVESTPNQDGPRWSVLVYATWALCIIDRRRPRLRIHFNPEDIYITTLTPNNQPYFGPDNINQNVKYYPYEDPNTIDLLLTDAHTRRWA